MLFPAEHPLFPSTFSRASDIRMGITNTMNPSPRGDWIVLGPSLENGTRKVYRCSGGSYPVSGSPSGRTGEFDYSTFLDPARLLNTTVTSLTVRPCRLLPRH